MRTSCKCVGVGVLVCCGMGVGAQSPMGGEAGEVQAHIHRVETCVVLPIVVTGESDACVPLLKRMQDFACSGRECCGGA